METEAPASARRAALTDDMRVATKELHSISDKWVCWTFVSCSCLHSFALVCGMDSLVNLKLLVALTDKELYGRALLLFCACRSLFGLQTRQVILTRCLLCCGCPDYIYAQLEVSIRECKDLEVFHELNAGLKEFARVSHGYCWPHHTLLDLTGDIRPNCQADNIAKDLGFFLGNDWSTKYTPTPAVQAYVK